MNRDWTDFKSLHSNISGAREAFENACETLFRKVYVGQTVNQVKVKLGDGGIDVFIGEIGIAPITVIQCKFFLESFDESQKAQIRESFKTAIESEKYELKEWILCIPRILDIDQIKWWTRWKDKAIKENSKAEAFISLKNGNELIDLFKSYDLYNQIFEIDNAKKIDEIHKALIPIKTEFPKNVNPQIVLFNNYSSKSETYYLERNIDNQFINYLNLNNLWVFGNSGYGKTALLNRNLTKNDIEYCYCDLSPISIKNSDDVLEEILCRIEDKFDVERNNSEKNIIKQITEILCNVGAKKITIVIDELSVNENSILKNIANDLLNLVTHFCNKSEQEDMKFVVSTISNPKDIIENKSKATEHFQYLNCDDWSNDIDKLFEILNITLNLNLSDEIKTKILSASQDSPRILKSIFRKILSMNDLSNLAIENAIKITTSELVK
jgi:hypothetical protein